MSVQNRNIKEGLQRLTGSYGRDYVRTVDCVVTSVDKDNRSCSVEPITGTLPTNIDVMLSADPNDGMILYPSISSTVRVAFTDKSEKYILQYSDIDEARITIGEIELIVNDTIISLNGESFGGLVKVDSLVTKLNNLENLVNTMVVWSATVAPPFVNPPLIPTTSIELENKNVKHG